jgi:four helix bundle protein
MCETFKEMPIWKKAMEIAEEIHTITENLPKKEDYGFTSQIRRAALSIPSNIAEAYGRHHIADKINFYYMSRGSLTETQSHLEYGKRVNYIESRSAEKIDMVLCALYNDINKIILSLKRKGRVRKDGA